MQIKLTGSPQYQPTREIEKKVHGYSYIGIRNECCSTYLDRTQCANPGCFSSLTYSLLSQIPDDKSLTNSSSVLFSLVQNICSDIQLALLTRGVTTIFFQKRQRSRIRHQPIFHYDLTIFGFDLTAITTVRAHNLISHILSSMKLYQLI